MTLSSIQILQSQYLFVMQTDNTAMKRDLFAPYTCADKYERKYLKSSDFLDYYSESSCHLLALLHTYRELYNCSLMSITTENHG